MTSTAPAPRQKGEFTGRKMLAVMVLGFGIIIAVNVFMAYNAVTTFPGLEVKNSYVASQEFDRDRKAQESLGWTAFARMEGNDILLSLTGADGAAAEVQEINAKVGRPTESRDDREVVLTFDGSLWRAPLDLPAGSWRLWVEATSKDGIKFRQRLLLKVPKA